MMSLETILQELVVELRNLNISISQHKTPKPESVSDSLSENKPAVYTGRTLEEVRNSLLLKTPRQTDIEDDEAFEDEEEEVVVTPAPTPAKKKKSAVKKEVADLTENTDATESPVVQEIVTLDKVINLAKAKVNQGVDPEEIRTLLRSNYQIAKISEAAEEQLGMIYEDLSLLGEEGEF